MHTVRSPASFVRVLQGNTFGPVSRECVVRMTRYVLGSFKCCEALWTSQPLAMCCGSASTLDVDVEPYVVDSVVQLAHVTSDP